MNEFALRSRKVVTAKGIGPATVTVSGHKISDIAALDAPTKPGIPVEDLGDLCLLPGLVDTHVHINEPGRTEWEGYDTGTQAAAAGGITTLVDMPLNCSPVTTSAPALQEKLSALDGKLWIDCGFWGGVIPSSLDDLEALLEAGVLGVKSFTIDSGLDEFPPVGRAELREAMTVLTRYRRPYLIHAELDSSASPPPDIGVHYQSFLASRPHHWETDAVKLLIEIAAELKAEGLEPRVHVVHLSSAEAIELIRSARVNGLNITAETCPHYLTLCAEEIPDGKTVFKCCPPIREQANCDALWQGLAKGDIGFVVSDHSPCLPVLKHIDSGDLERAWGGISSLQFGLPLMWTAAWERQHSLVDVCNWMCHAPAKFSGLGDRKGRIQTGYDADLVIFDDKCSTEIDPDTIRYRHKITPYAGRKVRGKVMATYLRGQKIYGNDTMYGKPLGQSILAGNQTGQCHDG